MASRTLIPGLAFIVALQIALETSVSAGLVDAILIPPPSVVGETFVELVVSGSFLQPLAHTLLLLCLGYSIASLAGIGVGLLMGTYRPVFNLLEPLVELLRPLPKPALLPPLILFLGLGNEMKITIVALAAFFPVLVNTLQGVRAVEPVLIDTARTFGRNEAQIIWRVILPASAPLILAGMKVALGLALVLVVLSEMLASTGGLGYVIIDMQRSFRVPEMYAWIVMLGLVGLCLTALFNKVERRIAFWHHRATGN